MRLLICWLVGHDTLKYDDLWQGRETDCNRCGLPVKWLPSFGWVLK